MLRGKESKKDVPNNKYYRESYELKDTLQAFPLSHRHLHNQRLANQDNSPSFQFRKPQVQATYRNEDIQTKLQSIRKKYSNQVGRIIKPQSISPLKDCNNFSLISKFAPSSKAIGQINSSVVDIDSSTKPNTSYSLSNVQNKGSFQVIQESRNLLSKLGIKDPKKAYYLSNFNTFVQKDKQSSTANPHINYSAEQRIQNKDHLRSYSQNKPVQAKKKQHSHDITSRTINNGQIIESIDKITGRIKDILNRNFNKTVNYISKEAKENCLQQKYFSKFETQPFTARSVSNQNYLSNFPRNISQQHTKILENHKENNVPSNRKFRDLSQTEKHLYQISSKYAEPSQQTTPKKSFSSYLSSSPFSQIQLSTSHLVPNKNSSSSTIRKKNDRPNTIHEQQKEEQEIAPQIKQLFSNQSVQKNQNSTVTAAQQLNIKVLPVQCENDGEIKLGQQTKKLIDCLRLQISLDEQLRNAKIWLDSINKQGKWRKIKEILSEKNIEMNQKNIEQTFENNIDEHNPFFSVKNSNENIRTIVEKYLAARDYWQKCILNQFDFRLLKQEGVDEKRLDLNQKGHLTVQDFVRFMNIETGTFYRNRDLILIFKRLTPQKNKLTFQDFSNKICK